MLSVMPCSWSAWLLTSVSVLLEEGLIHANFMAFVFDGLIDFDLQEVSQLNILEIAV